MLAGIFIGLGIAGIVWLSWYLSPLGTQPGDYIGTQLREGSVDLKKDSDE